MALVPWRCHLRTLLLAASAAALVQCKGKLSSIGPAPQKTTQPEPSPLNPVTSVADRPTPMASNTGGVPEAWFRFDLQPPVATQVVRTVRLWSTYYYLPVFRLRPGGTPIRNASEQSLFGNEGLTVAEWCDLALQGSARIQLNAGQFQAISFADRSTSNRVDCTATIATTSIAQKIAGNRFEKVSAVFARPARSPEALPFRTIAVDPSFIAHGSTVFIPSARGTSFVFEGRTLSHDGYFFAADSGSAIIGNHIDLFTGTTSYKSGQAIPFRFVSSSESSLSEAQIVKDVVAETFLRTQHRYSGK